MTDYHETAQDFLTAWDRGELVYSVDTSERGWEFEEPIQVLAAEVVRACLQLDEFHLDNFDKAFNYVYRALQPQMPVISALQQRYARWLAWNLMNRGPAGTIAHCKEEGLGDRVLPIQPAAKMPDKNPVASAVEQVLAGRRMH